MAVAQRRLLDDVFSFSLQSTSPQTLKTYDFPDNTTAEVTVEVTARQEDSSNASAAFIRTLLLARSGGGPVTLQGRVATWHADKTIKSLFGFDLGYSLGATSFTLTATCAVASAPTTWLGTVTMLKVN
jgi:hypothetical protein